MKMLKKMTPKTVMGTTIKAPSAPTRLYTIFGVATGMKKGESSYGPWTMLTGSFEAIKEDGEKVVSTVCALPQPMHDMIIESVKDNDGSGVRFATAVILAPSDVAIGYEYFAEPLIEQEENDPLSELRSMVTAKLPAPTEPKKATPKKATK